MKSKKIIPVIAIALASQIAMASNVYASELKVNADKLIGKNRYETAIEVGKKGWGNGAVNAVLVNDNSIVDALAATPFAYAKDAPILLTQKDTLNEKTKEYLKSLGVKNVYLIGGEGVISKKVEQQLKSQNFNVDRIQGKNREATSLEIAKRLDAIKPVSKVSLVNGYVGLADAVSIAAVSANENMPIILSNVDNISKEAIEFIDSNKISKSYIVGGKGVVSSNLENKLPNATRISGQNRQETNAEVIKKFFNEEKIDNLYVAKDGAQSADQLIDALSVGSLAAKTNSPVMIVGKNLTKSQKDLVNSKSFKTITQVGGSGNENVFNEIKNIQNEIISSKPEDTTKPEVPSKPEDTTKPEVPSKPEDTTKPEVPSKPEDTTKPEVPSKPEDTTKPEVPSKPEDSSKPEEPSTPVEKDPVYPENITLFSSRDGKNKNGLGDTTYENLKSYGWKVESDNVLSAYNGSIKFENLNGKDNKDAKLIIKSPDKFKDKDILNILTLMNGKESQYSPIQLGYMIGHGPGTIKDGSRYIEVEYETEIIWSDITLTFSNFGITPVHDATEGSNKDGFGDTTYDELKNSGWRVDGNDKVTSNKGNVSFTNKNGVNEIDAILEITNGFDKNDNDTLYALSLMLNSKLEADEFAEKIQEAYDNGTEKIVTSNKISVIVIEFERKDKDLVKIKFHNMYKNTPSSNNKI